MILRANIVEYNIRYQHQMFEDDMLSIRTLRILNHLTRIRRENTLLSIDENVDLDIEQLQKKALRF